jgi:hypothetical protein
MLELVGVGTPLALKTSGTRFHFAFLNGVTPKTFFLATMI